MKYLGIDIGSRAVKIAAFDDWPPVLGVGSDSLYEIYNTSDFYRGFRNDTPDGFDVDFSRLGIGAQGVCCTGYGRNNVKLKGTEQIVELRAHTMGAVLQTGLMDFTLLDAGGQDSKIISVRNGIMSDMALNDKCAASCGRYLENMALILGITLDELSVYKDDPVELNSTCAVFSESELLSGISEGVSIARLAAGVNYSLFKRILPLVGRFPSDDLVVTGGVALNKAFIHYLKAGLNFKKVIVPAYPQYNGAIGCCAWLGRHYRYE